MTPLYLRPLSQAFVVILKGAVNPSVEQPTTIQTYVIKPKHTHTQYVSSHIILYQDVSG